jgi:hypothetical protein
MALGLMSSLPGHRASHTLRRSMLQSRIGRLLHNGLRDLLHDLRVRVTAVLQRGACECSDACCCCELPATALCAASRYSGGGAPAGYTYTPEQSVDLVFLHRLHHRVHQPFLLFYIYICMYVYICNICILYTFSNSCFTAGLCIISMHNMFMIYVCIHIYIVTPFSLLLIHVCMYMYTYYYFYVYNIYIYIYICFTPSCFIYHMCIICSSSLSIYIQIERKIDS